MRNAVLTAGFLILAICLSIFFTLAPGEEDRQRAARNSNASDELEELGEGIRLGMNKEEVIRLWGEQPANFDGVMDGNVYTAFQFRTGQWDITGPKEIVIIGREAHQFGKTGKIIFVFWNEQDKAGDVAICYRTEESEKFRSFYTGDAGKDKACGTDGYIIVKDSGMFFVKEEEAPLFKNAQEAESYFGSRGEYLGTQIEFVKETKVKEFLKTGDKAKIWYELKNMASKGETLLIKELFIMDSSLEKKD
ncbi:hypothetical protein DRW41_07265 [Neobacillus piezotolerans]|uniref:Uncharacterized protein n=1 Tax=Neobacillus piezotolerans TaxID=2259171 RepID=A0A3D8GT40_9BACI|nr:hypothetical protein [Neobacillus piezotolerans]RDU37634.1 hypothetical protein DRW41_07265 [Neobacillus piezotolerans]